MAMRSFYLHVSVLVIVFFLFCYKPCFADPIAKVLSLVPGVVAERKGENIPLKVKDDIYLNDVLRSDASGKVQIIFEDDTVLTLGNNTTFSMQEYNDTDSPAFKGEVGKGFAPLCATFTLMAAHLKIAALPLPAQTYSAR